MVKFDEAHEKVVSAKATGYKSEWPGGWMEIDKDNNVYDDTGVEHMEGELEERSKGIPVRAASRERDTPIIKRGHQALFLYRCSIHWIHWYRPIAIAHRMMMEVITMLSWNTCDP